MIELRMIRIRYHGPGSDSQVTETQGRATLRRDSVRGRDRGRRATVPGPAQASAAARAESLSRRHLEGCVMVYTTFN